MTTPDPKILPEPHVEVLHDAVVVPVGAEGLLPSGVYRADGSFVDHSRMLISGQRLTDIPAYPADIVDVLPGRHLFAGVGRRHFGHFLMESITRLWAVNQNDQPIDSVLFLPLPGSSFGALRGAYRPFYRALSQHTPFTLIDRPMRVEELIVPNQGLGHLDWATGTETYRRVTRSRVQAETTPEGPHKIYVSRSRLTTASARVDREDEIEALMKTAGYSIWHPEDHKIMGQCGAYLNATHIVGADGSAFHLTPYLIGPETKMAIMQRRPRPALFQAIVAQNRVFSGANVAALSPLVPGKHPKDAPHPLDLRALEQGLSEAGML